MDNIYGQTDTERYSVVEIPEGYAENAGNTLYKWLGSLWRGLNKGDGLVRGLQAIRGHRLAQMYLDLLEAAAFKDRNGVPVFHRELWHPVVVRKSQRDTAQENALRIGREGLEMGPQPEGSVYSEGTVLKMGRLGRYEDYVTYPLDDRIVAMSATIVDNIVNPAICLSSADGDYRCGGGAIVFPRDKDPLSPDSPFEKYDIPAEDSDDPEDMDVEAVLWASDVLIDRDYIANHLSYALGANAPSSDVVKRILNAAWSSIASGLTPELVRTLIAAMLNIPVIQGESETVLDITSSGGHMTVITDGGSYRISPKARLRSAVRSGAVLHRGDLLDESVRIYPFLNSPSEELASSLSGTSVPLREDIPSVTIPRGMLRVTTENGVYAMWNEVKVKRYKASPTDANGNPRLYFDIGGSEADVKAFWKDAWASAEEAGVSMESLIGEEGSDISPAGFFLRNLVGANTLFVVVDGSQVDDLSMMRDPMFFGMLSDAIPSAIRLFLVERLPISGEDSTDIGDAEDSGKMSAALPEATDASCVKPLPGLAGRGPSSGDFVTVRFVRPAPLKVAGRKEEG